MKTLPFRYLTVVLLAFAACAAFAADTRKKLVLLISEPEYETAKSLPPFAAKFLEKEFRTVVVSAPPEAGEQTFDRIEEIADADVLLVSVRRHAMPPAQLDVIRRYVMAGKPVVGIRTAGHAFALAKNAKPAAGFADWPEWDAQVMGGNYTGHHGKGPITAITASEGQAGHVLLRGVALPFTSGSWLYKEGPLKPGAQAVITGAIPGQPAEPLAWTFKHIGGGRTFFTSLGNPADFESPSFQQLLRNGILWAAGVTPTPSK